MSSFKELCDCRCGSQAGNDKFGSSGSFGGSSFCSRPSLSFQRDQGQDVPSSFRNPFHASGNLRGLVHINLNGEMLGKFSGKIENLPGVLGCLGNFGNLGNMGMNFPFSVQFGDRTV